MTKLIIDKVNNIQGFICGAISGLLAFAAPMKASFMTLFAVILFDLITGVWASRISNKAISSRRMRESVRKTVGYFEVIFILFIVERGFEFDFGTYRFVGGFICFIEIISILENTSIITGNKVFMSIIKLLRGKAQATYGEIVDEILKEKNN